MAERYQGLCDKQGDKDIATLAYLINVHAGVRPVDGYISVADRCQQWCGREISTQVRPKDIKACVTERYQRKCGKDISRQV